MTANRDSSPATSPKASSKPGDKVPVSPRDDDADSTLCQSSDDSWASGGLPKRPTATAKVTMPIATVAVTSPEVIQRGITVGEALPRSPVGGYSEAPTASRVHAETPSNPGGYSETPSVPAVYPDKARVQPGGYQDASSSTQGVYAETPNPAVYPQTSATTAVYSQQIGIPGQYSETPSIPGRYPEALSNPESCPEKKSTPGGYFETPSMPERSPVMAGIPGRYSGSSETFSMSGSYSEPPSNPGSFSEPVSNPGSYSEPPSNPGSYSEPPSNSEPPNNPGSNWEALAVGGDPSNPIFRFGRAYAAGDGIGLGVGSGHVAPVGLFGGAWGASLEKVGAKPFPANNAGTVSDAASLSDEATSPGSSGLGSSFHSMDAGLTGERGMAGRKGSSASFDAQGIAGSDAEPEPIAKRVGRDSSSKLEMKAPSPLPPPSPTAGGVEGGFEVPEYCVPDLGRGNEEHLLDAVEILLRDEGFEGFEDGEGGDMMF